MAMILNKPGITIPTKAVVTNKLPGGIQNTVEEVARIYRKMEELKLGSVHEETSNNGRKFHVFTKCKLDNMAHATMLILEKLEISQESYRNKYEIGLNNGAVDRYNMLCSNNNNTSVTSNVMIRQPDVQNDTVGSFNAMMNANELLDGAVDWRAPVPQFRQSNDTHDNDSMFGNNSSGNYTHNSHQMFRGLSGNSNSTISRESTPSNSYNGSINASAADDNTAMSVASGNNSISPVAMQRLSLDERGLASQQAERDPDFSQSDIDAANSLCASQEANKENATKTPQKSTTSDAVLKTPIGSQSQSTQQSAAYTQPAGLIQTQHTPVSAFMPQPIPRTQPTPQQYRQRHLQNLNRPPLTPMPALQQATPQQQYNIHYKPWTGNNNSALYPPPSQITMATAVKMPMNNIQITPCQLVSMARPMPKFTLDAAAFTSTPMMASQVSVNSNASSDSGVVTFRKEEDDTMQQQQQDNNDTLSQTQGSKYTSTAHASPTMTGITGKNITPSGRPRKQNCNQTTPTAMTEMKTAMSTGLNGMNLAQDMQSEFIKTVEEMAKEIM